MMILYSVVLTVLCACIYFQTRRINSLQDSIVEFQSLYFQDKQLENAILKKTTDCLKSLEVITLRDDAERSMGFKQLEELILKANLVRPMENKKDSSVGANRNPRTEEQKRLASEQRKAWWAKKRAQEQQQAAPELEEDAVFVKQL